MYGYINMFQSRPLGRPPEVDTAFCREACIGRICGESLWAAVVLCMEAFNVFDYSTEQRNLHIRVIFLELYVRLQFRDSKEGPVFWCEL